MKVCPAIDRIPASSSSPRQRFYVKLGPHETKPRTRSNDAFQIGLARPLFRSVLRQCALAFPGIELNFRPRSRPTHRSAVHGPDSQVHDRSLLHLAAGELPSGLENRAHAGQGARRHFRSARHASLCGRCVQIFSSSRGEQSAREGLHHRPLRGRARDDRCRHRRPQASRWREGK